MAQGQCYTHRNCTQRRSSADGWVGGGEGGGIHWIPLEGLEELEKGAWVSLVGV